MIHQGWPHLSTSPPKWPSLRLSVPTINLPIYPHIYHLWYKLILQQMDLLSNFEYVPGSAVSSIAPSKVISRGDGGRIHSAYISLPITPILPTFFGNLLAFLKLVVEFQEFVSLPKLPPLPTTPPSPEATNSQSRDSSYQSVYLLTTNSFMLQCVDIIHVPVVYFVDKNS